jgi:DNA processing protein
LRDGAIAVLTGEQVMEEYAARFPDAVQPPREEAEPPRLSRFAERPQPDVPVAETADDKKDIDKPQPPSYIDLESIADTLSPTELAIMESICAGERLIDNVIAETGLSAGEVLAAMTILEIRGLVTPLPGHRVEPGSK